MLNKRQLLGTSAAALVLRVTRAAPAQAQVASIFAVVVGAISALASGLQIYKEIQKWMADKRCLVPITDLEDTKFRCQMLTLSIIGPSTSTSVQSTFSRLLDEPTDRAKWHAFKLALGAALVAGGGVMESFNGIANKLGANTYPGARSDLENAYRSVNELRAAVTQVANLPDQSTVDDVNQTKEIFERLVSLADTAIKAEGSLQAAIDDRRQVKCP
jgi:hypothetical protein